MDKVIEKWDEILQILKVEYDVANVAFNTWLKPLKVYDVKDNVVTILVPSEQSVLLDIVNKKYRLPLQVTICEVTGMDSCEINFILPENIPKKENPSYNMSESKSLRDQRCEEAHLNPKYTFDSFIVGSNNKFAQAAALAVADVYKRQSVDSCNICQFQKCKGLLQEIHSFFQRIQKAGFQMREGYLQGNSGESCSCTYVHNTLYVLHIYRLDTGKAVQKMLYKNLLKFHNPGKVHDFIFFYQIFIKIYKLLPLLLI